MIVFASLCPILHMCLNIITCGIFIQYFTVRCYVVNISYYTEILMLLWMIKKDQSCQQVTVLILNFQAVKTTAVKRMYDI